MSGAKNGDAVDCTSKRSESCQLPAYDAAIGQLADASYADASDPDADYPDAAHPDADYPDADYPDAGSRSEDQVQ